MTTTSNNSFGVKQAKKFDDRNILLYSLPELESRGLAQPHTIPYSIRILWESALRNEDGKLITRDDVERLIRYNPLEPEKVEIPFMPARVLLQDFTGVPCVVDLAAMRSAMARLGGD
ncbi:MAG: aconitate hydratase, partial [bacterium]